MDQQGAALDQVWHPAVVVGVCRPTSVAAVDEQERQRDGPGRCDRRRVTNQGHHRALEVRLVDRVPELRQGVDHVHRGIDEVGLVPLPAGLVLLGPTVVVEGEQEAPEGLGGGTKVEGRLAAVAAHLQIRAVGGDLRGVPVQGQALVGGHEAPCGPSQSK